MGMKIQVVALITVVCMLILGVSGCTSSEDSETTMAQSLIGSWNDPESFYQSYTFYSNGTCIINGALTGIYELDGGNLTVTLPDGRKELFELLFLSIDTIRVSNIETGDIRTYDRQ